MSKLNWEKMRKSSKRTYIEKPSASNKQIDFINKLAPGKYSNEFLNSITMKQASRIIDKLLGKKENIWVRKE